MEILDVSVVPGWIATVCVFLLTTFLYSRWKQSLWKSQGVPGPNPTPFLGIMRSYFKKGTCYTDLELTTTYGPIVGVYHCNIPVLLVTDPEMLKEIFVKEFSKFPERGIPIKKNERMLSSLAIASGTHWKFLRSTISPTFTIGRIKQMALKIKKCCKALVANMETQTTNRGLVDMKKLCEAYTMDVIATTAFGIEVDSQKDPNNKFVHYGRQASIGRLPAPFMMLIMMFPFLRDWIPIPNPNKEVQKFFTAATRNAVKLRDQVEEDNKDFLQLMINARHTDNKSEDVIPGDLRSYKNRGLNETELSANSTLFFLAGYDTTANTLSFASYVLATHQDIQQCLIDEIDSELNGESPDYESISKLTYLEMFLYEVLRLYGAAIRFDRECSEDVRIKDVFIPKGTFVAASIFAAHRNPEYWPDPEKFDPYRFTEENKAKRPEFSYIPFGIGPRICIGMRLALLEAKMAIVHMMQNYKFSPCEQTEVPVTFEKGVILRATNGIHLKIEPRK